MLLSCFICGILTGICMASARVPVDGAALLVVAGAGFLVANEDDETASKPWTLEAYVAAIHKLAVDMHDDTFIKATVSVQAVLDDDPRTLRLLEIL
jgi:ABC-type phosphate transport system permease subunit